MGNEQLHCPYVPRWSYALPQPLISMEAALYLEPIFAILEPFLHAHAVAIHVEQDHCLFLFPEGTVRRRIFPLVLTERWKITLPDGLELVSMTPLTGYPQVYVQVKDLPEEARNELLRIQQKATCKESLIRPSVG